jgi:hypothetical protein
MDSNRKIADNRERDAALAAREACEAITSIGIEAFAPGGT